LLGADASLAKPFSVDELVTVVRALFDEASRQ
jgi:DNA-binding response OmpR family regulator